MALDIEELLKLFEQECPLKNNLSKEKNCDDECKHIFIPLFNTFCCKFCGIDQDRIKK